MTEGLSGIELRRAVAEALGWTKVSYRYRGLWAFAPIGDLFKKRVLHYEHDLNAVFRDVVPFAEALGYYLEIWRDPVIKAKPQWVARFGSKNWGATHRSESLAPAICRAFVALRASEEEQEP